MDCAERGCHGEIFNMTNGDVFRWSQVFPSVAAAFAIDYVETADLPACRRNAGKESLPTIVHPRLPFAAMHPSPKV
jgi:hypothetical protein